MLTTITATSWNGTPFIYNSAKDTWEMADNVTVGTQHAATFEDLQYASDCAMRENFLYDTISLTEQPVTL